MIVAEPAIAYIKKKYTIPEYLEMESTSDEKHEYYQGEIFAMAGAKVPHNVIFSNLFIMLGVKLLGKPCQPYGSDTRVHIPQNTLFTYPDITVICGEILTLDKDQFNVINPTLIVEINSPATLVYDLGEKFHLSMQIEGLKEYVCIDSTSFNITSHFVDERGQWMVVKQGQNSGSLYFRSLGLTVEVADVYAKVKFEK